MDGPCGRRSNASCKVPPQRPGTRDHDPRHEGGTLADQNFQLLIKHVRRRAEESRVGGLNRLEQTEADPPT
jgi:hypothetical protein